jgi:hypothetical protein
MEKHNVAAPFGVRVVDCAAPGCDPPCSECLMEKHHVATPFGVRVDYTTPDGEMLYSEYMRNSGGFSPTSLGVSWGWHRAAAWGLAPWALYGMISALLAALRQLGVDRR